jgi:flagellin
MVDSLTTGIGGLTDTDMEAASAKLQALQVQSQLGVQALSIANSAPQSLLSLFR